MKQMYEFIKGAVLIIAMTSFVNTMWSLSLLETNKALQSGFLAIWSLVLYIAFKVNSGKE